MLTKAQAIGTVLIVAVIATLLVAYVAFGSDDTQTCPSGQSLAAVEVNGDKFVNGDLPPGASVTDSVSGSGLNYTVEEDSDSATLHVEGKGSATFKVTCR